MAKTIQVLSGSTGDINTQLTIMRYDAGLGTYTILTDKGGGIDYFDDAFEVGDILYIAGYRTTYSWAPMAFKFTVATPISATSYTLAWEFYHYSDGWSPVVDLVDETESFSLPGENWVWWKQHQETYNVTVDGLRYVWFRCRVTAVDTPTEGGAQTAAEITFTTPVIHIDGGTEADPITLLDIYNAAEVQRFNLCEQLNSLDYDFLFHCTISQAAGSFALIDRDQFATFYPGYTAGGTWTFGSEWITDPPFQMGNQGGTHIRYTTCRFDNNIRWAAEEYRIYNTSIWTDRSLITYGSTVLLVNSQVLCVFFGGGEVTSQNSFIERFSTYTAPAVYNWDIQGGLFSNAEAYQNSRGLVFNDALVRSIGWRWNTKVILFNCDVNSFSPGGNTGSGFQPSYAVQHFGLTLTVLDENNDPLVGAGVTITDANGDPTQYHNADLDNPLFLENSGLTTDGSGQIDIDILYFRIDTTHDSDTVGFTRTDTYYGPFDVLIEAAGYRDRSLQLAMDSQTIEQEVMTEPLVVERSIDVDVSQDIIDGAVDSEEFTVDIIEG